MDARDDARMKYECLDLSYLRNSRIVSCYVNGPHGWCNWDGTIFTNTYNIGKWPNCKEVLEDWQNIAEHFPFLKLKSQLWSTEQCEEGGHAVIQYNIANGTVEV